MVDAAYRWLEAQQGQMKCDLTELCNMNSGSNNIDGLLRVAQWLEDWLTIEGVSCQRVDLPPRRLTTDAGTQVEHDTGPALRWDFRPQATRRVLLAIHYDTVFGAESAFQVCSDLSDDRMQGPGVADAKGGIVVLKYALEAARNSDLAADLGWTILLNPDEEVGSPSSTDLFSEIASEFDFGLLFEPALPTRELVSARKGSGNFDIVVRGKSAHAGRHFEDGRNAVAMLSRLMSDLDELNGTRQGVTVNVGAVRGGGPVNVVPDLAVGRFNARVPDQASLDWFGETLQTLVSAANAREGFEVELYGGITSPPKLLDAKVRNLMKAVEAATEHATGMSIRWRETGGVCDGNKLAAAGLPNIDTLGPIGDGLHSSQEWVQISSLVEKAKVIVRLLDQYSLGSFTL